MSKREESLSVWRPQVSKKMREYVRQETKTDEHSLEERRDRLQIRIGEMMKLIEALKASDVSEEEKAKVLNTCNLYGMLGMLEGMAFLADCLSTRVILKKKKDGVKTRVPVRYSLAMTGEDIAGGAMDSAVLLDGLTKIVRDQTLIQLDETGEVKKTWFDENGLLRCPHYREESEGDDELTAEERIAIAAEDKVRRERLEAEEKEAVDGLRSQYVETKKPGA